MAAIFLAIALPDGAGASDGWKIDPDLSEVKFVASKFREPLEGSFKSFQVDIEFDPEAPRAGRIKVEIDTASVSTGVAKIDELLRQPDWFATESHPVALFEASGFDKIDDNRYAIEGIIKLKGKSEKILLEANVDVEDDPSQAGRLVAKASSEITIKRLEFLVGTGPWADVGALADEVKLLLKFAATRPKASNQQTELPSTQTVAGGTVSKTATRP